MHSDATKRQRHIPSGTTGIYWSLRADGKKTWEYRVDRKYYSAPSYADAKAKLGQATATVAKGGTLPSVSITVGDLIDRWLVVITALGKNPRTIETYTRHAERIRSGLGTRKAVSLTPGSIIQFLAGLKRLDGREGVLDPGTKAGVYGVLSQILQHAWEEGLLAENAARRVPRDARPRQRRIDPRRRIPNPGDLERIMSLDQTRGRWLTPIILVGANTGAREGEILGLGWSDIDFDANRITISGSLGRNGVIGPTKGKKTRVIPLFPEARRALLELRLAQGQPESGPVFRNQNGDRRSVVTFQAAWRIARDRAGLGLTFHEATRHNFVSRCAQAGIPLNKVQAWAGHSSLAITERYLHVIEDEADNERAAAAIAEAI